MGFQNGNFQFIGRYHSGPFNFNVSKTGVSSSIKNKRGVLQLLQTKLFKFQIRWNSSPWEECSNLSNDLYGAHFDS